MGIEVSGMIMMLGRVMIIIISHMIYNIMSSEAVQINKVFILYYSLLINRGGSREGGGGGGHQVHAPPKILSTCF